MENKKKYNNVLNGALAGFAANFVTQPLQVVRTNMMIRYYKNKPAGFLHIIKLTYQEEGIRGFYRSIYPSLLKSPLNSGTYFGSLEFCKANLSKVTSLGENSVNFLSSALARTITCTVINPLIIVITRFEMIGFDSYSSTINGLEKIYAEEGLLGYFKGIRVLVIKEVPTAAVFYPLYESIKKIIKNLNYNIQIQSSVSAIIANTILTFFNNPLDVIRTRLQYVHFSKNKNHEYRGIVKALKDILTQEGLKGIFVGITPRLIKRTSGSAIAWTVYETLKERHHKL